ncbi:winged helix-turn-helix domain-containing protein [Micromonospora sp. FIMYZ51]|uniref:winged helix-turn-helix domain-containing protein n=1 Tax=Micromonospora sp. FIMYZ51 TaxID=3051832 RepID=UPI00311F79C4
MSVVAISPRQHPPGRPDRVWLTRPRTGPTLTITVDLAAGPVSPRLRRLMEVLSELAESGEGRLSHDGWVFPEDVGERAATADVGERAATAAGPGAGQRTGPADPNAVRILTGPRVVQQGDRTIQLTRIEYDLLLFLAERPRRVFTRVQLLNSVWGYDHAVARTVDVHVRRLRAKLGADTPILTTVHGVGYRLADEARVTIEP